MARAKAMARKEASERVKARAAMARGAMAREKARDGEASIRVEKGQVFMAWKASTTSNGQCQADMLASTAPRNGLPL